MTVLQAWKDSLDLLKPQNLKLLALVTVNSWIQGWKALFQSKIIYYVVAMWCAIYGLGIIVATQPVFGLFFSDDRWFDIYLLLYALVIFLILGGLVLNILVFVKAIRPSVERKTFAYFKEKLLSQVIITMPVVIGLLFFYAYYIRSFVWPLLFFYLIYTAFFMVSMVAILWIFFLLDTKINFNTVFSSGWRALKMVLYNVPLFLVCVIVYITYLYGVVWVVDMIWKKPGTGNIMLCILLFNGVIIYPLYICLLNNIYIKKLHEQFDLYFSLPEQKEL